MLSPGLEARIPIAGRVSGCVEGRYDVMILEGDDPSAIVVGVGVGVDL